MEAKKTPSKFVNGRYENAWKKWPFGYYEGPIKLCKWLYSMATRSSDRSGLDDLKIMTPYFANAVSAKENEIADGDCVLRATWLGHASVLVEIDGFRILCDPVFSGCCPPKYGPHRYRDAPCTVEELGVIDAVLISHNHYDHMDHNTIAELSSIHPEIQWFVPMKDRRNLEGMLVRPSKHIHEMDWWDTHPLKKIKDSDGNSDIKERSIEIAFTPTQHWSNRGVFDSFKSLWGSWVMKGSKHSFWFGGDTGYCGAFKEIGDAYGGFDMAAIPIGAYAPRNLVEFQHVDTAEAIQIHKDIKSKHSFGIHWGTFQLTSEPAMEPKQKLDKLVEGEKGVVDFRTVNHGETMELKNGVIRTFSSDFEASEHRASSFTMFKSFITWFIFLFITFRAGQSLFCSKYNSSQNEVKGPPS